MTDCRTASPKEVRSLIREEIITTQTSGMCAGYAQANLVVLPRSLAFDFLLFAQKNHGGADWPQVGVCGT